MSLSTSRNSEYAQISGYIPKELALKFRVTCKAEEVEISEVLEQLISEWLKKKT
ncbi:hypothetical protein LC574_17170 [Nostoc sp. CHAB 5715]|nr:hypothetical protein [Nostoc sp. CHAB 5715]